MPDALPNSEAISVASSEPISEPGLKPSLAVRGIYWVYRSVVSPVLHAFSPAQCVYLPTCSEYAYVALVRFGVWKGSWLALRRLARCHPFAKGGFDPVPQLSGCETRE